MPDYHTFTAARTTEPDPATLLANLKALDATAGAQHDRGTQTYVLKKATAWTAPQITAAQNALNTAPAASPQLTAQSIIDGWDIAMKAFALTLIDKINDIDANLAALLVAVNALNTKTSSPQTTLPKSTAQVTDAQVLNAIRTKAGTL